MDRIKKIEIFHLNIPLAKPYVLSKYYGTLYNTEPVVVKITTENGVVGYGETDPMGLFTSETPETCFVVLKKYLAPSLIGQDPTNINGVHEVLDGSIRDMHVAKTPVDIACYDIFGKICNVPVSKLLGGRIHDSLPIMGSIGGGTPEENAKEAIKLVKELGYHSLMVKIGSDNYKLDAERTKSIADAVGNDVALIPDANQGWDITTTLKYLDAVSGLNIDCFEQPIAGNRIDDFAKIKQGTNVKLSADESLLSIENAKLMIKEKSVDVFSIKVSKLGGLLRSEEVVDLAFNFGIDCLFNSMIEEGITQAASFALGVTTKNLYKNGHAYFSPLRLKEDISDYSTYIKDGRINIPDYPGLGIKIDEEKLNYYSIEKVTVE